MVKLIFQCIASSIVVMLIFLCSTPAFSQFKLAKVEEFRINSLANVDIVDYSPKNGLYLGFMNSTEGEKVVLINQQGGIIANEKLKGEGPNQYVSNLNAMAFTEDGDIWLQTVTHLLLYDPSLVMKKKISYPSSLGIQIYGRKEVFSYFYQNEAKSGFSFIANPSGTNSYMSNSEINSDLIEIYEADKDKLYRIAPVTDRSVYGKFEKSLISSLYFIIYSVDKKNSKLFLTTRTDNEITVYDLKTYKLESRIKVNHGEFKILGLTSISEKDQASYQGTSLDARNHKLFVLDGDLIVLDYTKEIPYGTYAQKIADDPSYNHFQDAAYHRLLFFEGNKQVSEDIPVPKNGRLMMSLPKNQLLFKVVDPDVEEDFIRYEVYELVKE